MYKVARKKLTVNLGRFSILIQEQVLLRVEYKNTDQVETLDGAL